MDVPAVVRSKALAAGAMRWVRDLPELVADLEREWSIAVGRPYDGGTEAFVAEATLGDGTPAVLKRRPVARYGSGSCRSARAAQRGTVARADPG